MKRVKLVLDVLMLAVSLTLFSKSFFGMAYHEIAGLALVGLCLVHIVINLKTAVAMCRKFLRVPTPVKVGLGVDLLLILCYGFLGLSGVMISKTILTGISAQTALFRVGHTFAAAGSVILLGVHIGLHICRRPMKPALAVVLTVAVLCGGLFGVLRSSELRWLSMPFAAGQMAGQGEGGQGFHGGLDADGPSMGRGQGGPGKGLGKGEGQGHGMGQGNGEGWGRDGRPELPEGQEGLARGEGMGAGHGMGQSSVPEKLSVVAMFGGMILSCSMLTYWAVILTKSRKKAPPADRE